MERSCTLHLCVPQSGAYGLPSTHVARSLVPPWRLFLHLRVVQQWFGQWAIVVLQTFVGGAIVCTARMEHVERTARYFVATGDMVEPRHDNYPRRLRTERVVVHRERSDEPTVQGEKKNVEGVWYR